MKTDFKNVLQLLDYYKDDAKCKALLAQQRWPDGKPACPHCGSLKTPYIIKGRGYKCSENLCYKKFSVTVGTIYENSNIKLRYWFAAIYLVTAHKKGISSHQLARDIGVTQKTAWFLIHRIREMLQAEAPERLSGVVETDETYWGGAERNKHEHKRDYDTAGGKGKAMVLGVLQREGAIVTKVVPDRKARTLLPIMVDLVVPGSTIYSDELKSYQDLKKAYTHDTTNHRKGEYVRGSVHTNGVEGFWSHLKRGIHGTYHQVSTKHLQSYCNEFAYRYNTRKQSDNDRFFETLKKSSNFKLTYKALIAK